MTKKRAALYAGAGSIVTHYALDVEAFTLAKRGSLTLPNNVQYAWPHSSKPIIYVVCSSRTSRDEVGANHSLYALKIDEATGDLTMHGAPVTLPLRALHVTTDNPSRHVLLCSNVPSGVWVFRLQTDGTLGELVPQRPDIDLGIVPHQVRVTADNRMMILVTRGNPADRSYKPHQGNQKDPGALKVFEYRDGILGKEVSFAPGDGYRFGPRHLDFHPTEPWIYVSLETQSELYVYKRDGDTLLPDALFRKSILPNPEHILMRQAAGTVHVHPNGRTVYCANQGYAPQPYEDKQVVIGADNSLVAFSIDPTTGEPNVIQHIDSAGVCPRTFALDPSGRMLVAANAEAHWVKDGRGKDSDKVRWVPGNLATFRVLDNGRLEFQHKYDAELGAKEHLLWMGIVAY